MRSRAGVLVLVLSCVGIQNAGGVFSAELAEQATGQEIYQQLCAKCHGPNGEGVPDKQAEPLQGNRTLAELTKLIHDTMPEGEPEKCVDEDAARVAEYIFETFYTAEARERNRPPRIELSRLTVRQYQLAVADLLSGFASAEPRDDQRGLAAQYFNARQLRGDKKVLDRIDSQVAFDFAADSPVPETIGREEFAVRWRGSLLAEETGEYEFCVKTANAARLWVNNQEKALIDAWVKSGDTTEYRGTVRLLGGRTYPLRLEFFKFKEPTASITLEWKPPHGVSEVVPARQLAPTFSPEVLVVETAFPPDDSSVGYERGTSVSRSWDEAATNAALEVADYMAARLRTLADCPDDAADRAERLRRFCYRLVERAFRRPLTDEQKELYVDARFAEAADPDAAVKRVILLTLKSPRFLYLGLNPAVDDYDVAARLSFGLWDSPPDPPLLEAAARGELRTQEQVVQHARRMLDDPRAKAKLRVFFHDWLRMDEAPSISKDKELFPDFGNELIADLRKSLELFVEDVVWSEASDFRQLLLAENVFLNERLARVYGVEVPADGEFHRVALPSQGRAGVLTHPYLMTILAYYKSSSPIHRGVFVARGVLGRTLKPPPMAIAFVEEAFDPGLTTRERVAQLTKAESCQACHSVINPLGFSLENYDAIGRFRTEDRQRPIDASAVYPTATGEQVALQGARALAEYAAQSPQAVDSFVQQLFHHLVKQPTQAYGANQLVELRQTFLDSNYHVRTLLAEIMRVTALRTNPE